MNDMFKLAALWDLNNLDNFHWSIMIGYGNTGSYIPKICPKMLVTSGHFIFSPFFKRVIHFSLRNSKV